MSRMIARVRAMVKRGSLSWLRKKCQVLRTRRPTGLDHATLTAPNPNVKNGNSRHGGPRPRRAVINQERESRATPRSSLWCAASISRKRSTVRAALPSLRVASAARVS